MAVKPSFAFQWHITDVCDQRCKHCYIFSEDECKQLDSMTWPQLEDTFFNCLDFCEVYGRTPHFYITGGDPILHPDFWRLLELLHGHGAAFTVMGNPFHLTDEACARMKALGCAKYQLSLDGMEATHDWFRKPGSFRATLDAIDVVNRAGLTSVVMTTVSAANIDEVPAVIDTVAAHDVGMYAFARYCPTSDEKDVGVTPERYRQLLADCDAAFKRHAAAGCRTFFNKKDHLWTLYDYETGTFTPPADARPGMVYGGCNCGNCHLTILPTGEVYACRRVEGSCVGNTLEDRLADVWVCGMEAYRNFAAFEKCARCELGAWCRGCPAVATGVSGGDFYAEDPQCWKEVA